MPEPAFRDASPSGDRRSGGDRRRRHHLFTDWRWIYRGRRRRARRSEDQARVQPDWYRPSLLVAALGIVLLSGLDAALTLTLLSVGVAEEANPVMRAILDHDAQIFVNLKTTITAASVVVLVVCSKWSFLRRVRVDRLLFGVLALYAILVVYELHLLRLGRSVMATLITGFAVD